MSKNREIYYVNCVSYPLNKRLFDILLSLLLLVLTMPLISILVLINLIILRSNPFFVQNRAGFKGKPFKLIKVKTMLDNDKLLYEKRVYKYAKFLRRYKIDELPQLINVLKGNMSLVGPRPLLLEYNKIYNNYELKRLSVVPGITGLAQINVKNTNEWKKKIRYDIFYVKKRNFSLDILILLKTVVLIIKIIFLNSEIIESHKRKND